ncbi:hypothetical protein M8J75_008394 [Diaphorina citri]|nr:hypothetical protein M8J75_008394 [Diaphorina citri]
MSVCNSCGGDLPLDGGHVVCGVCGGGLHYGCSTVSEASWRSMSNPSKAKWKCGDCRGRSNYLLQRTGSFNSLSGNLTDGGGTQESRKKDDTITLSKMEALLDLKFKLFKEDVEKSLNYTSGTVDDLSKSFKNFEQKIITMQKNQEKLEAQNQELRKRVKTLEVLVQDMAQAGNQCKVEISSVPTNVEDSDFTEKLFEKTSVQNIPEPNTQTKVPKVRYVETLNTNKINRELTQSKWEEILEMEDPHPEELYDKIVQKFHRIYEKCRNYDEVIEK